MTIYVQDMVQANSSGIDNSIQFTRPTGVDGDMFLAVIGSLGTQSSLSAPAGWTKAVDKDKGSYDRQIQLFYKVITDITSEASSYTFSGSNSLMQGAMFNLRGRNFRSPTFETSSQSDTEGITNADTPALTTTLDDTFIMSCVMICQIAAAVAPPTSFGTISGSPTLTKRYDFGANFDTLVSNNYWVKLGVGTARNSSAGSVGGFTWPVNDLPSGQVHELGFTTSIKETAGGVCGCNAICDNDCSSNQICTGHVPACSNDFTFTTVAALDIINSQHLGELESAINAERADTGRRYNASEPSYCDTHTPGDLACTSNSFGAYSFTGARSDGDIIYAQHWTNVKNANNLVTSLSGYGSTVTETFYQQSVDPINSIIEAEHVTDLQDKINETRNVCICDSHCNCDPSDCGCNGECPSDDYYGYYYP